MLGKMVYAWENGLCLGKWLGLESYAVEGCMQACRWQPESSDDKSCLLHILYVGGRVWVTIIIASSYWGHSRPLST